MLWITLQPGSFLTCLHFMVPLLHLVSPKMFFSIPPYSPPPEHHKVNAYKVVLAQGFWVFGSLCPGGTIHI